MAHGQPEPGAFAGGFRCEKRVENLIPDFRWNARTIVADADLYLFAEISCHYLQLGFEAIAGCHGALGCRVKSVRDQVQEYPGDLLRVNIRNSGRRIEIALQRDVETLLLCAGSMVGEVQTLVDDRVDL